MADSPGKIRRILDSLRKQTDKTWHLGYIHDGLNRTARKRWKDLTVLLSGGATLHPQVAKLLQDHNPKSAFEKQQDLRGDFEVSRHIPEGLKSKRKLSEQDLSLYAVANGLAVEEAKWPDVITNIEPLEPPEDE